MIGPIRCPMLKGVLHTNDYYPEILVFYGSFTFFLQLFYESFTVTWGGAGGRGKGKTPQDFLAEIMVIQNESK